MTGPHYFPRDRTFWWLHGSALLATGISQLFVILAWRDQVWFNIVGTLVWLPLFTLGVLAFRYLYLRRQWQQLNMGRLILTSLVSTLAIGIFVTLAMLAVILPLFWQQIFTPEFLEKYDTGIPEQLIILLVSNMISTQLLAIVWVSLYLSISIRRRAREMELHNLKLENSLKEAQLTSLTNQLNPHFLFNSLNNIRFVIHESAERADHTITALSDILRYSLESSRRDKVPLHEEMAVVDRYLEVMALQLEDRLQFDCSVPETLDHCLLPPMSLQLLAENAIKHGIENLREPGSLTLQARDTGDKLIITLSNTRCPSPVSAARNTGTGLDNLRRRLHLLYGSRASLVACNDKHTFTVTLTLPKEEHE